MRRANRIVDMIAGSSNPTRTLMIATTTSSSIRVKPARRFMDDAPRGSPAWPASSILIGFHDLTVGTVPQHPEGLGRDRGLQQPDRAVAEGCDDAAGMDAGEAPDVGR